MVGLSIVLETQKGINKKTQVINKITMMTKPTHFPSPPARWNSHSPLLPAATTFLDECFLCKQKLLLGKDIYMYKGDRAFCMWSWCKDGAQPWKCSCCLP
uniref:FLZ-type domain-containing protein n=2 Tax=Vitis vinifera TaxID=29760 RepID=F6HJF8_VITVI